MNELAIVLVALSFLGVCATNNFMMEFRVKQLEARVSNLEANQSVLTDASTLNSDFLQTDASMLNSDFLQMLLR